MIERLHLITDTFSTREDQDIDTEYLVWSIEREDLTQLLIYQGLADKVEYFGGGAASAIRASIGTVTLLKGLPDTMDGWLDAHRYNTEEMQAFIENPEAVEPYRLPRGLDVCLVRPTDQDKVRISFFEKHSNEEVHCTEPVSIKALRSAFEGNYGGIEASEDWIGV